MKQWRTSKTKDNLFDTLDLAISENRPIHVIDFETTGLSAEKHRPIQLEITSFLVLKGYILEEVDSFGYYINPEAEIPKLIEDLTGITNAFIEDKPIESEIFSEIFSIIGNEPIIAAYNSGFDIRFLTAMYKRNGEDIVIRGDLDVMKMAKDLIESGKTANYKLKTISDYYDLSDGIDFHNASSDTFVTSKLLEIFIDEYQGIKKDIKPKEKATINSLSYWAGYKGYSRIYTNTNKGTVYFDVRRRSWGEKDEGCLGKIDMEDLINKVYEFAGVDNEDDFMKFKEVNKCS